MQLHTSVYSSVLKLWYEESAKVWSHEESFCCTTKHCMYNLRKLWTNLAYRSCYTLQGCIQPRLGNQWLLSFRLMKRKLQGQKFFWSAVGCSSVAQTVSQQPESIFALDKKRAFSWSSVYRAMHFSAKRGIAIACRLSVRLSVCNVGELWSHRLEFFENDFMIS